MDFNFVFLGASDLDDILKIKLRIQEDLNQDINFWVKLL